MPNIAPEWEVNKEANKVIQRLIDTYPEKLGHVDPSSVACAYITNKDRPESTRWYAKIVGAKPPLSLFTQKAYVIYCFKDTWDMFTQAQRSMMILEMLLRIPDEADGTVLQDDLKGLKVLIARFGVEYMEDPDLPDVADARQNF